MVSSEAEIWRNMTLPQHPYAGERLCGSVQDISVLIASMSNEHMSIYADSLEHSMLECTKPGYRLRSRQKLDLLRKHMRL